MYKILIPNVNINPNKFHGEIGDLGLKYAFVYNVDKIELYFFDLFDESTEENRIIKIKTVSTVEGEVDDDNDVIMQNDLYSDFDIDALQTKIQGLIDLHDSTAILQEPTVTDIMANQITQLMLSNAEKDDQLQTLANQVTELMLGGM